MIAEFMAIPSRERAALFHAMAAYRQGIDVAWKVDKYPSGILRIRNRGAGSSGRCLFFATLRLRPGEETLVALAAYKKEGQDVPKAVMQRAESRLKEWKRANGII
jgi:phage-related protein